MARTTVAPHQPADGLRAADFLGALHATAAVLQDHAAALDRLDAVEDWDLDGVDDADDSAPAPTDGPGTDLANTLTQACAACGDAADFPTICASLADGAAVAAATLAGRRLAGFLAGAAEALRNVDRLDGLRMALALESGAERLAAADDGSHPGALPAVVAASADAALGAADGGSETRRGPGVGRRRRTGRTGAGSVGGPTPGRPWNRRCHGRRLPAHPGLARQHRHRRAAPGPAA